MTKNNYEAMMNRLEHTPGASYLGPIRRYVDELRAEIALMRDAAQDADEPAPIGLKALIESGNEDTPADPSLPSPAMARLDKHIAEAPEDLLTLEDEARGIRAPDPEVPSQAAMWTEIMRLSTRLHRVENQIHGLHTFERGVDARFKKVEDRCSFAQNLVSQVNHLTVELETLREQCNRHNAMLDPR